ncbi:Importin-5 [Cichlidogyrus casuarinus]|uniref:Importin-5 n=1 Tax=Cichlidogyrus casuarinus TaxID=1844966 RepID=A0ABD2QGA7_9PLAT
MANLQDFSEILKLLQSPENDVRNHAETAYEAIEPSQTLSLLLQTIDAESVPTEIRIFAAVLARRLLSSRFEAYTNLPEEAKVAFKSQLLLLMQKNQEEELRRKICDIACQLVNDLMADKTTQEWPELLQFMIQCSASEDMALLAFSFYILRRVPGIFADKLKEHFDVLTQMLSRGLSEQNPKVMEAVLIAIGCFLESTPEEEIVQALKPIVPKFLQAIAAFAQHDPENEEPLKALVQIADSMPKFLRAHLKETLDLCYQILINRVLDDSIRNLALEVMVTLAENTPAAVRKAAGDLVAPLVDFLLNMMCDLEDDPEWATLDTMDDEDEATNAVTAELALDRISCALGGKTVLSKITAKVPEMLSSPDWKHRHAGLMAVSACGEGCQKQMEDLLPAILQAIVPRLGDDHPRVRYAACNTLGQMAVDFAPKLQKAHHATIIPALMHVMSDSCARVQAIACAAIVNFCEKAPKIIFRQYLDPMITKLEQVMSSKFQQIQTGQGRMVLEQILTTVSSVADASEEEFVPYYDRFMPVLKYIMEQAVHPDYRMLRGKTIECISLIGLAVGKERFMQDAGPIIELLFKAQQQSSSAGDQPTGEETMQSDDPQLCFMIGAWARICKLMGPDFLPYLPMVMPQVLKTASIKPDVCVVDDDQADNVDEDENWQVVKVNDNQNFAIRTSGLEDKSTACSMLLCYARELKQDFAPYVEQVLEIMLPTLKFYFYDEVRDASAEIMPYLLDSIKPGNAASVPQVWARIFKGLMEAINNEPEREVLADQLQALAGCILVLGDMACHEDGRPNVLSSQQLTEILHLLDRLFHEHFEKANERLARRNDEDYDELEEERLMTEKDDDEFVLCNMYELMNAIFSTYKVHAVEYFKSIMVHCVQLLKPDRPWSDLQWGLAFWGDLVEFGGSYAWQFKDYYLQIFATSLSHEEPGVRQNSVSNIGNIAMHGPVDALPFLTEIVPHVIRMIESPNSRNEDNNKATENAISCLTKMMKYKPECLHQAQLGCSMEQFLSKWVQWLPIWEDDMETEHVYKQLCDLVESNNPHILGENNSNIPHIVGAIAQVISAEGITPKTGLEDLFGNPIKQKNPGEKSVWDRCVGLLRQVLSNQDILQACLPQLTSEQQKALESALKAA